MATDATTVHEYGLGKTQRRDAWWAGPLVTALVLGSFVIYTTFRIFQNAYFQFGHGTEVLPEHSHVLSPLYSPLIVLPVAAALDFAGDADSVGAGRISRHVLLLSQGVLPGVLSRSAGLRGGRAAGPIPRRDAAVSVSEPASLLFVFRADVHSDSGLST